MFWSLIILVYRVPCGKCVSSFIFLQQVYPVWLFQWFKDICRALGQPFCFYIQCQCVCACMCVCIWTETKWSKIILSLCCNCEINLHNNLFALLCTLCPPLLLSSPSHPHMEVERPVACNTSSIATCTVHKKPATARQIMRQVRSCGSKSWGI